VYNTKKIIYILKCAQILEFVLDLKKCVLLIRASLDQYIIRAVSGASQSSSSLEEAL